MNENDQNQLVELLREWYRKNKDNRHRWRNTVAGIAIKKMMILLGHWKNKPRGNPAKGYLASQKKKIDTNQ